MEGILLPRKIEALPLAADLAREIAQRSAPLWEGGSLPVPRVRLETELAAALKRAFSAGRIVRGLEDAERTLAAERAGLQHADRKTGIARGERISRLLVLADDGAPRFYRNTESLLRRHAPRVLALRLSVDQDTLGALIFGAGQRARLLLVERKDSVSDILLVLAASWHDEQVPNDA